MKIGILDIGCEKISCFIASLQNNCKPEIIGIGHRSSQGIKPGIIADIELAQQAIISAIQTIAGVTTWVFVLANSFWTASRTHGRSGWRDAESRT